MFLFQVQTQIGNAAARAGAAFEYLGNLTPDMYKIVKSAMANPDTKYVVRDMHDKEHLWTLAEIREYVKANIKGLKNENALEVLRQDIYGFDDATALKLLQSQVPWATEKSLVELRESGSNAKFKDLVGKLCDSDWMIDNLLQAEIVTSNVGNNADSMNKIGLQSAITGIKSTLVVDSYAFSSLDKAVSGQTFAIKAAGSLGNVVSFEVDPDNLGHMCTEIKSALFTASCTTFDFASSVYLGATPEAAMEGLIENGNKNSEKRATRLFGKSFVDNVGTLVTESVMRFFESRAARASSQEALSSIIINQLQMINTVRDLKENSEFVQNISDEERKKRDARGGFA